ncbi:hypothetical protein [Suttonella ornithocola]|uniref:Uncharacterized protein n=1 Tax=Suttonella ornithocola TaxID=279832 RepID=A0A380MKU6_9GAMM|nr:hypothetical protein [Suttonella ornithocola]SUO93265.1 Uncharacterised protein [Suttonella ornithocola]
MSALQQRASLLGLSLAMVVTILDYFSYQEFSFIRALIKGIIAGSIFGYGMYLFLKNHSNA